jgi:hypothetical protein
MVIYPELFRDAVLEKLDVNLRLSALATDYSTSIFNLASEGEVINFPQVKSLDEASVYLKGESVTPQDLDMTNSQATVQLIAQSTRIYDVDLTGVRGNVMDIAVNNVAQSIARKVDSMCADTLTNDVLLKSATAGATAITEDEVFSGLQLFSDQQDVQEMAGIVINPALLKDFMSFDLFVNANFTTAQQGNGVISNNGFVGTYRGIPLYISANGTLSDDTTPEAKTFIIKKGALGKMFKFQNVESERLSKSFATDITASAYLATHIVDTDGIVMLKKTIA